ncbi:MAG: DUF4159 domain-containing protein [Pseudomonadota bacterium]
MIGAAIAFSAPFVLLGLLALPLVYWLVRAVPPQPRRAAFPPVELIKDLPEVESPPSTTPPWLILFRLAMAALIIIALAGPLLRPRAPFSGTAPVVIVVDNGWQAASRWSIQMRAIGQLVDEIERQERTIDLVPTALDPGRRTFDPSGLHNLKAEEARAKLQGWLPVAWPSEYQIRAESFAADYIAGRNGSEPRDIHWFHSGAGIDAARALFSTLEQHGRVTLYEPKVFPTRYAIRSVDHGADTVKVELVRGPESQAASLGAEADDSTKTVSLVALTASGEVLAREPVLFEQGAQTTVISLGFAPRRRNDVRRFMLEGVQSAGAVHLLDDRAFRPHIALISQEETRTQQPLKSGTFYIKRALAPVADIEAIGDSELTAINRGTFDILIMTDSGRLPVRAEAAVSEFVEAGGVLIRFAGPRLGNALGDPLVPVRLRGAERAVGGVLSWDAPQGLGAYSEEGPFAELSPANDVSIDTQILAEPQPGLAGKTWAQLVDGTPLVTGAARGRGWLVLVHTTAGPRWSNLALSGSFVDMLGRLMPLAAGGRRQEPAAQAGRLQPLQHLDGFGALDEAYEGTAALETGKPVTANALVPAGYYGRTGRPIALNLQGDAGPIDADFAFAPPTGWPDAVARADSRALGERDLRPPLWVIILMLVLVDLLIALWLRGVLGTRVLTRIAGAAPFAALRRVVTSHSAAVIGVVCAGMLGGLVISTDVIAAENQKLAQLISPPPPPDLDLGLPARPRGANGQNDASSYELGELAQDVHLAYVPTGQRSIDEMVVAGLDGLGRYLSLRTAVSPAEAIAVDPARDPLGIYPFIYWPVTAETKPLSAQAIEQVRAFMREGGLILFDTGVGVPAASRTVLADDPAVAEALRRLVAPLDMPPLASLTGEHVLARSFYLLNQFPGRLTGKLVWVENDTEGQSGRVSRVIIGAHDWARAWAVDEFGRPLVRSLPGRSRQRELAYRFGINMVLYALTGTYKADQVHLPALLERLDR